MADPDVQHPTKASRFEPLHRTPFTTCVLCKQFVVDPVGGGCYKKCVMCYTCAQTKSSCPICYSELVFSLCHRYSGDKVNQYWRTEGRCSECPFLGTAKEFLTHDCYGTTTHTLRPTVKKHLIDGSGTAITSAVVNPPSRSAAAAAAAAYGDDDEGGGAVSSSGLAGGNSGGVSSITSTASSSFASPSLSFVESVAAELRRVAPNFKDGRPPPKSAFVADRPADAPLVVSLPWLGYAAHLAQQAVDAALGSAAVKNAAATADAARLRDDIAVALARFSGRLMEATRDLADSQGRATPPLKAYPTYHAETCVKALALKALDAWKEKELRALDAAFATGAVSAAAVATSAGDGEDESGRDKAATPSWRDVLPAAVRRGVIAWIMSFFPVFDAVCRASRVSATDGCLDLVVVPGAAAAPKLVTRAQLRGLLTELQLACRKRDCSVQPGQRAIARAAALPRAWFERFIQLLEHCRVGDATVVVDSGVEIEPIPTADIMAFDAATSLATVDAAPDRVVTLPEHVFNALWMRIGGGPKLLVPGTLDAADRIAAIVAPACALRVSVSIDAAKDAAAAKQFGAGGAFESLEVEVPPHMLLADVVCTLPDAARRAGRPFPAPVERALLYVLGSSLFGSDPAAAAAANGGGSMLGALLNRGATAAPAPVAFKLLTDTASDAVAAQRAARDNDAASAEALDATPLWLVLHSVSDALTTTASSGYYSSTTTTQLRGVIGLTNLGNTCFMNSGLQCLSNLPFFREVMLRCAASRFAAPSTTPVASALINMLRQMWAEPRATFSPNEIKSAIGAKVRRFAGYEQQDAIELVGEILDKAHDELNPVARKCFKERTDRDADVPEPELSRQYWDDYLHNNESPITQAFAHQVRTRLECLTCGKISIVFDAQTTLAVSIEQHNFTIYDIDVFLFSSVITPPSAPAAAAPATASAAEVADPASSGATVAAGAVLPETLLAAAPPRRLTVRLRVQSDAPTSVLQTELRRVLADDTSLPPGLADTVSLLTVYSPTAPIAVPTMTTPPYAGCNLFAAATASLRPVTAAIAAAEKADEEEQKKGGGSSSGYSSYSYREKPAALVLKKWARLVFYLPGATNACPIHFEFVPFDLDKLMDAAQRIAEAILPGMLEPIAAAAAVEQPAAAAAETAPAADGGEDEAPVAGTPPPGRRTRTALDDSDEDVGPTASKGPVFGATGTASVNTAGFAVGSSAAAAAAKKKKGAGPFGIWVEKKDFYPNSTYSPPWNHAEYTFNSVALHFDDTQFQLAARYRGGGNVATEAAASSSSTSTLPPITKPAAATPNIAAEHHRSMSALPSNAELKKQQEAQGMLTLERCLEALRETHLLKGDDAWFCPRCREHREATMEQQIYVPPRCLTVHFKRFKAASHGYLMNKIDAPVAFPLKLDLSPFMSEHPAREAAARGETIYALRGVVNHSGSLSGGHYTAAGFAELHKSWATFDDSYAHLASEPPRPDRAYILFYELLPSGAPPLDGHAGSGNAATGGGGGASPGAKSRVDKLSSELD